MRVFGKINIIGLDNGYGNIKTANGIFPASVTCCEAEPAHAQDVLVYDGKYYVIGAGHREFTLDKVGNQDHYLLTLAGIGQELWCNQLTTAAVHLAVGLPLTWVGDQREQFRAYLSQNRHVDFNWRGINYHVDFGRRGRVRTGVFRCHSRTAEIHRGEHAVRYWKRHHDCHGD